jgi:hypothetical protein
MGKKNGQTGFIRLTITMKYYSPIWKQRILMLPFCISS